MMRALAVTLALWIVPALVQASITCEGTGVAALQTTDPSVVSYTIPANANQSTFLAVHDRGESNSVVSVTGGGCVWTLRAGPFDNSGATAIRVWLYVGTGCTPGAATITVDLGAVTNTALAAASCWSSVGALTFTAAGPAGAENTALVTTATGEALTFTAAGVLVTAWAFNNNVAITSVGANQDDMTATASRAQLTRRLETSGTFANDIPVMGSTAYESATVLMQEPTGGGGTTLPPTGLLTTGVGR